MTEEEAKTKWCPFARLGSSTSGLGGLNRFASPAREADFEGTRCIGSACMAWRWHGVLSDGRRHTSPEAYRAAIDPSLPPQSGGMNEGDVRLGFCGLAGKL